MSVVKDEAVIATAPGKLLLTGEYAVLDGGPALVIAVDRRVIARRGGGGERSAFLEAVVAAVGDRGLAEVAREIRADSTAFYDGDHKLGLGSSAAVTVAAVALALAGTGPLDRELVCRLATVAHGDAQAARGARGSGADIAASTHGGAILYAAGRFDRVAWPGSITLLPFWTGQSADTPTLVAAVTQAHAVRPSEVGAALTEIAEASRAAARALAGSFVAALERAADATDRLARASGIDLVPPCVTAGRAALARLGGTAKTTGAGGGDIAIGVIPATADVTLARQLLIEAGCKPLPLFLDETGVDLRAPAQ